MKSKRKSFGERITTPIIVFFVIHTMIVAGAAALFWPLGLLIGVTSAMVFGLLLREQINKILSYSLKRIMNVNRDAPKLSIRDEDVESQEEIAMLYAHFSELINNFNTLQIDIGAMADDHLKGIQSTTIDEGKYRGAMLELVKRVNAMGQMYAGK